MESKDRSNYRKLWERHTGLKIPRGWHIHHIDGNSSNNGPENLRCVSPTMHWWAHYLRGDPVALYGKFIQGAAEAGRLGGRAAVESGQLASIQTKENQAKGHRNRDPNEHREWGYTLGYRNVENGVLARARELSPTLGNKEWGRKWAAINGRKNKDTRWVTNVNTGEDRKLRVSEANHLSGEWRLGRTHGGRRK